MDYNYAILNNGFTDYIVSKNDEWISHCLRSSLNNHSISILYLQ